MSFDNAVTPAQNRGDSKTSILKSAPKKLILKPVRKHGKDMRRLLKLVTKAVLNPSELFKLKLP
jgi:hypothetical protein